MAGFLVFLGFIAFYIVAGIISARDMRPELRPPEWSVGRLIQPRS
jgi:hypothetical protein